MYARSLTARLCHARRELLPRHVDHRARRIIHRPRRHASKETEEIVAHEVGIILPLGAFQAMHTLVVEHIGIGAGKSGRLVHSVEIDDKFVLCRHFCRLFQESCDELVVAIHVVDLETLNAELRIS